MAGLASSSKVSEKVKKEISHGKQGMKTERDKSKLLFFPYSVIWYEDFVLHAPCGAGAVTGPQGSVLGLVLFILFISDVSSSIQSSLHSFADDRVVLRSS